MLRYICVVNTYIVNTEFGSINAYFVFIFVFIYLRILSMFKIRMNIYDIDRKLKLTFSRCIARFGYN